MFCCIFSLFEKQWDWKEYFHLSWQEKCFFLAHFVGELSEILSLEPVVLILLFHKRLLDLLSVCEVAVQCPSLACGALFCHMKETQMEIM